MEYNKEKPKRFYELKDLQGLNSKFNKTDPIKIFVCNTCSSWNKVHESDLIASDDLVQRRKKEKMVVHIELNPELGIMFKKFKDNFGTYEKALIVLMSDFHKNNH